VLLQAFHRFLNMREWITPNVLALLRSDAWFGGVSRDFEVAILSLVTIRRLRSGEHLFSRGDATDGLYAVLEGSLRISGTSEAGKDAIFSMMDPPSWFGEIAQFDQFPRTHNAVAEDAVRVLHVPQLELLHMLEVNPRYWRELGALMALRMRLAFINLEDQALLPVETRLARRLVWLVEASARTLNPGPCLLSISQAQLGLMLSLSRQTTNRALQILRDSGVLRVTYGGIEVVDRQGLMKLAGMSPTEKRILQQFQSQSSGPKASALE
jgi:CRP/FNR family cyclic AMP-dependent transcriptional regulator